MGPHEARMGPMVPNGGPMGHAHGPRCHGALPGAAASGGGAQVANVPPFLFLETSGMSTFGREDMECARRDSEQNTRWRILAIFT